MQLVEEAVNSTLPVREVPERDQLSNLKMVGFKRMKVLHNLGIFGNIQRIVHRLVNRHLNGLEDYMRINFGILERVTYAALAARSMYQSRDIPHFLGYIRIGVPLTI